MGKKKTGKAPTDYAVGRGKPPRNTRFQPGQSGNPGGRKKDSLNNKTILERVLNSEIVLSDHGKSRKVTVREALVLRCAQSGLAGSQRSIEYLLNKGEYLDNLNQDQTVELEQDDQDLLDAAMLARRYSINAAGASSRQGPSAVDDPDEEIDPDDPDDDDDGSEGPGSAPPPPRLPGPAGREGRS